jgi:hypothetical protein
LNSKEDWAQVARRVWPDTSWVSGDGPFAIVARCHCTIVRLYQTLDAAIEACALIDGLGCSDGCEREHFIFMLTHDEVGAYIVLTETGQTVQEVFDALDAQRTIH